MEETTGNNNIEKTEFEELFGDEFFVIDSNNIDSIKELLRDDDLLIITADHGNDPTYKGTDHTREMVPVLIYNKKQHTPSRLEDLETFASIGATIADNFKVNYKIGTSFLEKLK